MSSIHVNKIVRNIILILLIYQTSLISPAAAIGEASTSMYVYSPPGGAYTSTYTASFLVVTATQNNTFINITDLDRSIGDPTNKSSPFINLTAYPIRNATDPDLSETIILNKGQSRTIKVSHGEDGPDKDGTFFHIESDKPVIALTTTNQGLYQADFVPSISGTNKGYEFFVYLPSDELDKGYDLAVFAYENDTNVTIYNISLDTTKMDIVNDSNLTTSIKLSYDADTIVESKVLCPETKPILFLEAAAGSGVHGGHTYWVVASKPVSVQSAGTIGNDTIHAIDGGYFIPGYSKNPYRDGTGLASTFYVQLNLYNFTENYTGDTELYLINQNTSNNSSVHIFEWKRFFEREDYKWVEILDSPFNVSPSEMKIINELSKDYFNQTGLVKIVSEDKNNSLMDISVFATSAVEVSGRVTDDISAFCTGDTGYGGSRETIVYIPPPGKEPLLSINDPNIRYSHIYIYIHSNNTNVEVQAWNITAKNWTTLDEGIYNQLDENIVIDHRITWDQWINSTDNIDYHKMRVLSNERTTVQINNWNDNWACYVPGGTPPEFSAKISVKSRYLVINSFPAPRIRYTFNISNMATGDIGSDLFNLSVFNTIPDGIDQRNIYWSVSSNMNGSVNSSASITTYADNNSSGAVFTYNRYIIKKNEILTFTIDALLNTTYSDGTYIAAGPIVIDVSAKAENPFLGKVIANAKQPGTMILNYVTPGVISLY